MLQCYLMGWQKTCKFLSTLEDFAQKLFLMFIVFSLLSQFTNSVIKYKYNYQITVIFTNSKNNCTSSKIAKVISNMPFKLDGSGSLFSQWYFLEDF